MKSIGIIAWPGRSEQLPQALARIADWAGHNPKTKVLAIDVLGSITSKLKLVSESQLKKCDALLAIGGDGTVLSAARIALSRNIPILGVNTGRLGFLAEYHLEELEATLDMLISGKFTICPRIMLDFVIYDGRKIVVRDTVLNEVQIQAMDPQHMVDLEARLNGSHLTEYWADSLLISTPTGSTAYNLSAGGPILHPATEAFILNPVNPCSLSVRPLVISADKTNLTLQECNGHPVRIWADGRPGPILGAGHRLELSKSKWCTHFIQVNHFGFVEALRSKLGWTGKPKIKASAKG
jgi:NAD+ kinase